MIRVNDVVIRYPRAAHPAVDGITFDAPAGSITAIAGPNGSGKSTIVRAMLGRLPLSRGTITLGGAPLAAMDRRTAARAVAIVPQREEPVFPRLVRDFISLGRFAHGSLWSGLTAADHAACDEAIRRTDVGEYLDRRTDELSGGEWQRVRLARALAQGAGALVLDEPNSFLDIAHEMALFELLDAVARDGKAVLLISHELNLVARFATSLVLIAQGKVAAIGPPSEVMNGDLLERVYGWPVLVSRDPAVGAPVLVPMRRRAPA